MKLVFLPWLLLPDDIPVVGGWNWVATRDKTTWPPERRLERKVGERSGVQTGCARGTEGEGEGEKRKKKKRVV